MIGAIRKIRHRACCQEIKGTRNSCTTLEYTYLRTRARGNMCADSRCRGQTPRSGVSKRFSNLNNDPASLKMDLVKTRTGSGVSTAVLSSTIARNGRHIYGLTAPTSHRPVQGQRLGRQPGGRKQRMLYYKRLTPSSSSIFQVDNSMAASVT